MILPEEGPGLHWHSPFDRDEERWTVRAITPCGALVELAGQVGVE
jgi:hypothetical protein